VRKQVEYNNCRHSLRTYKKCRYCRNKTIAVLVVDSIAFSVSLVI